MPLDSGNDVSHRVHTPYCTVVEKGTTKGIVAARAAAEDESGLLVGYYFLQLQVNLLRRKVVIVKSGGDESGIGKHVVHQLCLGGVARGAVAVDIHEGIVHI
jgi:hypothetical protein